MTACSSTDEPLVGTAPRADWWWLVEAPGAWGARPPSTCAVDGLRDLTSDAQRRVLLVRRTTTIPGGPLRVWIVPGAGGRPRGFVVGDGRELASWPASGPPAAPSIVDGETPRLVICTNAARDVCCGVEGRALLRELGPREGLWECSHLGGHRFAPTALHLVQGMVYGRVTPELAARLLATDAIHPMNSPFMRGQPSWPESLQAASIGVLRAEGALPRALHADGDDENLIHYERIDASSGSATLHLTPIAPRPVSCSGIPEIGHAWSVDVPSRAGQRE